MRNADRKTVEGFGDEWAAFTQAPLGEEEVRRQFERYFAVFDWQSVDRESTGFDMGCGSGRWARLVAPRVGTLICIDASEKALEVARRNLADRPNCRFFHASFDAIPVEDNSMDFGYCLGVLHHIPDTQAGIENCVAKLKPGAPFLAYIYYAFDNRPAWFRAVWKCSDWLRRCIAPLPFGLRSILCDFIAAAVYFPLARIALGLEKLGLDVGQFPLSAYRKLSFYSMRTDALDRFGTRLEKRFTRAEIREMFAHAGLTRIAFHDDVPYWCVIGYKPDEAGRRRDHSRDHRAEPHARHRHSGGGRRDAGAARAPAPQRL